MEGVVGGKGGGQSFLKIQKAKGLGNENKLVKKKGLALSET